jgi:hypothetical protein
VKEYPWMKEEDPWEEGSQEEEEIQDKGACLLEETPLVGHSY